MKTKSSQIRDKSGTKTAKVTSISVKKSEKKNINATSVQHIRYAYAPILQEFRAHTKKSEARLWIPIETNLISRYEFATLTTHTRYIFVAILLYCAGNGIDEIPLDARFMSSVINVDFRAIKKSFDELLFVKLLQERKEKTEKNRKEQTDRPDEIAPEARVSVNDFNSFQNVEPKTENENGLLKIVPAKVESENGNAKHSQFSIEECLKYVEACQAKGDRIENARALASSLYKTGEADSFIKATLYPEQFNAEQFGAPVKFTDAPCVVCFGAKMSNVDGKGYRACEHCRNERGKATGLEPEGEKNAEES